MALEPLSDLSWRELVAQHRLRAGLTKQQLAERCGISRQTLYRIESSDDYQPTDAQIAMIEAALAGTYVHSQ